MRAAARGDRVPHHAGEVLDEPGQAPGARSAPAVDRLVRVPDSGDRVADARPGVPAVQAAQQHELRHRGVLVLVEENDVEPCALGGADLGGLARQPRGEGHLVAEVEHVPLPLARCEGLDEVDQAGAQRRGRCHVAQQLGIGREHPVDERGPRQCVDQPLGLGAQLRRLDEVLGELPGQAEHRVDDGRRRAVHLEVGCPVLDDVVRQLPPARLPEQPRGRLETEAQRVVAHQPGGVRVVGGDGGCAEHRGADRGVQPPAQAAQPRAHAVRQLAGRLARERQPEDPVRLHQAVGDEVDHPGGHGLRLARAGPGHDEQRLERCLDDGRLLVGRRVLAEQISDLRCGPHPPTTRPSDCAGHERRTGHTRHRALREAATADRLTVSATCSTSSRAQPGSASCDSAG